MASGGRRRSRGQRRQVGDLGAGHDLGALRESLRRELRTVIEVADTQIAAVESRRDLDAGRLELALAALDGAVLPASPGPGSAGPAEPGRRQRRRRRGGAATNPAAVNERREAVHRYLVELGRPASTSEIRAALNMTPHTVPTALGLLCDEGKVRRLGSGRATSYEATGTPPVSREATLQGKIVATVQERGWASADELAQVTGASTDVIERECGALIVEEVIRMETREGRPVYISVGRA